MMFCACSLPTKKQVCVCICVCIVDCYEAQLYCSQARNIMLHEDEAGDAITGLQQKTHYGRPRWSEIFESISRAHPKYICYYE